MKKFHFTLHALERLRKSQSETEEVRLAGLVAERNRLLQEARRIADSYCACASMLASPGSSASWEVATLGAYSRHVAAESARLTGSADKLDSRILEQRQRLLQVHRQVRILEVLREQKQRQWRAEAEREQEQAVAELVIARWDRGRG